MLYTICYHLYNLKNVKNTHAGVLLLVKLLAKACNFTKSNTPPWVLFTFSKLHKWYQTAQSITYFQPLSDNVHMQFIDNKMQKRDEDMIVGKISAFLLKPFLEKKNL